MRFQVLHACEYIVDIFIHMHVFDKFSHRKNALYKYTISSPLLLFDFPRDSYLHTMLNLASSATTKLYYAML